ncbi:MAG: hypothetical protein EOO37_05835 [Cytophagaceae bacterium]|nr:MAG: hypothetical protein EOO37_05835 [Cytophagaceae bacterium]
MQKFGIDVRGERFLFADVPVPPSSWLLEALQRADKTGFGSEKSRAERLVSPLLLELSSCNHASFAALSGVRLAGDPTQGLDGECDFVLSFTRLREFVRAPIFCIVAVGYPDIEGSTARCAAQLLGAARFNERENKPIPALYGCVTTGIEWRFLKFENQVVTFDANCYLSNETAKLLGVLQQIVDRTKPVA